MWKKSICIIENLGEMMALKVECEDCHRNIAHMTIQCHFNDKVVKVLTILPGGDINESVCYEQGSNKLMLGTVIRACETYLESSHTAL